MTRRRFDAAVPFGRRAGVAELVEAPGLGPGGARAPWRFDSSRPHLMVARGSASLAALLVLGNFQFWSRSPGSVYQCASAVDSGAASTPHAAPSDRRDRRGGLRPVEPGFGGRSRGAPI